MITSPITAISSGNVSFRAFNKVDLPSELPPQINVDLTKVLAAAVTSNTINDMMGKVNDFFTLICAGVCVVCMILFFVSAVLRGAEVTLNKVLLPIFAVDMLKANPERWNMFIFQYFISFISYLVQMFCFQMYAILYSHLDFTDFRQYLVMVGWLILCIGNESFGEAVGIDGERMAIPLYYQSTLRQASIESVISQFLK